MRMSTSFIPWLLYLQGKSHEYLLDRLVGGLQIWYGHFREERNLLLPPRIETQLLRHAACSVGILLTCCPSPKSVIVPVVLHDCVKLASHIKVEYRLCLLREIGHADFCMMLKNGNYVKSLISGVDLQTIGACEILK